MIKVGLMANKRIKVDIFLFKMIQSILLLLCAHLAYASNVAYPIVRSEQAIHRNNITIGAKQSVLTDDIKTMLFESSYFDTHDSFFNDFRDIELCTDDRIDWCRFGRISGFGYVCPCCVPKYKNDKITLDSIPSPGFVSDDIKQYFYEQTNNALYRSVKSAIYTGNSRLASTKFDYDDEYLFVTGNKCTKDGEDGVSILIPERAFDEKKGIEYRQILNMITNL